MREKVPVHRDPGLISYRCPPEVGFEFGGFPKVQDIPDSRDGGGCLVRTNSHRPENYSLTGLLNELSNIGISLLDMLLQHPMLTNQLILLKLESPLPDHYLC